MRQWMQRLLACLFLIIYSPVAFGASDDISRLFTFNPNTTIQSSQANQELNQLVTTMNGKFGRGVANTVTGNNTFSGTSLFSGIATFSAAPVFSTGVSFTQNNTHTGRENYAQTDTTNLTTNGDLLYDSTANLFKAYINGGIKTFTTTDVVPALPAGYRGTVAPVWATTTTFTIASIRDRSSDDTTNIFKTASTTGNIGTTGLNGLDAGTVANNTNYFVYTVTDGSSYGILISTVNEAVTGTISSANFAYTKKRQLPFGFRTDGSAHIVPFKVVNWTPTRAKIAYNVAMSQQSTGGATLTVTGQTNILSEGVQTSDTSIANTANWALPNSKFVDLAWHCYETQARIYEDGTTNYLWLTGEGSSGFVTGEGKLVDVPVSSAYKIGYAVPSGNYGFSLDVASFTVEVL